MNESKFIWSDNEGLGRSKVLFFRKTFNLINPVEGFVNIFADTRYRLIVNGTTIGHGPARFYTHCPQYDSYDVTPFLKCGINVIAVIVSNYGISTFQSNESIGGLICNIELDDAGTKLNIPSNIYWKYLYTGAYFEETGRLSFALGVSEFLDAAKVPEGWSDADYDDSTWANAVEISNQNHWASPTPRTIPLLDEREVVPKRLISKYKLTTGVEKVLTFNKSFYSRGQHHRTVNIAAIFSYIYSPIDQQVKFGISGGYQWINGIEYKAGPCGKPMRYEFTTDLKSGWNPIILIEGYMNGDIWEFGMAFSRKSGVVISIDKNLQDNGSFILGGVWNSSMNDVRKLVGGLTEPSMIPTETGEWQRINIDELPKSAYLQRSWEDIEVVDNISGLTSASYFYEFVTEVIGRPVIEVTAPAGTVIDLLYTERYEDSKPLHGVQNQRLGDRYICREGRQKWQVLQPRGMRYMEIVVRGECDKTELNRVAISRNNYPVVNVGKFECSDPVLNKIWQIGRDTQFACMLDVMVDCPWREQGLYVGDMQVQYYTVQAAFGDHLLMRHCLELLYNSQNETGFTCSLSHGGSPSYHVDYTMLTIISLWHYYSCSGDIEFIQSLSGKVRKLIDAIIVQAKGNILMDTTGKNPYVDLAKVDKSGENCACNAFYYSALIDTAAILGATGADGTKYEDMAKLVKQELVTGFWDDENGCFNDRRIADKADTTPSVMGNSLMLFFDIADEYQINGALKYLTNAMDNNFSIDEPKNNTDCNVTSYFSFYALGALYKYGKSVEAEDYIRKYWGRYLDRDAVVFWEYFIYDCSLCHAWSTSPVHYMSTAILGVEFPVPGNNNIVKIAPNPSTLQWASGVYPHPAGNILVNWQVKGDKLLLDCIAPEGVQVILADDVLMRRG